MAENLSILAGSSFLVCDRRGDVVASPQDPQGFFFRDTRFLSRWQLTANGEPLDVLSTDEPDYFHAQFFLTPHGTRTVSVIRKRVIGDGFHEDVDETNYTGKRVTWDHAMNSDEVLGPKEPDLKAAMDVAPVARPGYTTIA